MGKSNDILLMELNEATESLTALLSCSNDTFKQYTSCSHICGIAQHKECASAITYWKKRIQEMSLGLEWVKKGVMYI